MSHEAPGRTRERLFVYGTLDPSSGHPMGRVLAHNARRLGKGAIPARIARVGAYPAAIEDRSGGWLIGEVFEITGGRAVWRIMDRYEGCQDMPPAYERRQVHVRRVSGRSRGSIVAWCYMCAEGKGETGSVRTPAVSCG